MRLSRTDFAPLLAIVAGGVIGASLSLSSVVLRSPPEDVRPEPVRPESVRVVDDVTAGSPATVTEMQLSLLRQIYIERISFLEQQLSSVRGEAERLLDSDTPDQERDRAYELTQQQEREISERLRAQLLRAERLGIDISVELTATGSRERQYRELWPALAPTEVGLLKLEVGF